MKILHANLSRGFYGSERYCSELAAEQARAGNDVEVLIHDGWSDCAREMRKSVALANTVGAGTMRLAIIPRWAPIRSHRWFARWAFMRFRPDVVHTHRRRAARRIGREAEKLGIPHVATLHGGYDRVEHSQCDGLICVAAWQRDTLADFAGKVVVVPHWVPRDLTDAIAATPADKVLARRARWAADDSVFVFGAGGRLLPDKNLDRLVRAFRRAFTQGQEPVRLVIAGDGPQRAELAQLAAGDPRIVVAGAQENMAEHYLAFDAFVSVARVEPFGLGIVEAMAAGCPLLLTRTRGQAEFVTDRRVQWIEPQASDPDDAILATQLIAAAMCGRERLVYDLSRFSEARAARAIDGFYRNAVMRGD
jgi:glycosyltransferase involved in cell wall biosynthesis